MQSILITQLEISIFLPCSIRFNRCPHASSHLLSPDLSSPRHQASRPAHLRPVLQLAALARDHRHPRRPGVHPGRGAAVVLSEQEALPAARPPSRPGPAGPTPPAGLPGPGERLRRPLVRLLQPREGVFRGLHELRGVPGTAAAAAGPGQLGDGHQDLPQDLHGHTYAHTLPRGRQGAPASAHPLPVLTLVVPPAPSQGPLWSGGPTANSGGLKPARAKLPFLFL